MWLVATPVDLRAQTPRPIPPAAGTNIALPPATCARLPTFRATDRIVGTYYFYWYDIHSRAHIVNPDGTDALTTHPPTLEDFSYQSVSWHREQLRDMEAAGIDVVLPVFWGAPSEQNPAAHLHWSYAGLPPLVAAREDLLAAGRKPPRIGLFYDTSTLRHNAWGYHADLTTEYGRQWFYATVRDFFSMIPPRHWALMEGKPIVLLYSAAFARAWDQQVIEHTKREFAREFGGCEPWIAVEISWTPRARGDQVCAWGGALGLRNPGIASLGPGYDHSAVPGRTPLIVPRDGGKFYETQWRRFLRAPTNFVMIETWNEFHEGTDVCASREYGRHYIELTRTYADRFKRGLPPPPAAGPYRGAKSVRVELGRTNTEAGLRQVECGDGVTVAERMDGREVRRGQPLPNQGTYVYVIVDDSFKDAPARAYRLEVEYFDAAPGQLGVEFDGSDPRAPFAGAYSASPHRETLTGSRQWRRATFPLPGARFHNRQNCNADLRLVVESAGVGLRQLLLHRD